MTERQPTPGMHEHFAPILDDSGQGSGLWCEPARDGRDQARDYACTSHQAASAGHARGWRHALDAAVYVTTSVLSDMIVAGSGDLQEAHGKAVDAITSLYGGTPAPEPHVDGGDIEPRSRMQQSPGYLNSFETVISALKSGGKQAQDAGHIAHGACLLHAAVELEAVLIERVTAQYHLEKRPTAFEVLDPTVEDGIYYLTRSEEEAIATGFEYQGLYRRAAPPSPQDHVQSVDEPIAWYMHLWNEGDEEVKSEVRWGQPSGDDIERAEHNGHDIEHLYARPAPENDVVGALEPIGRISEGGFIEWIKAPIRRGTTLYAAVGAALEPQEIDCVCKRAVCSYDPDFGCGLDQSKERQDV